MGVFAEQRRPSSALTASGRSSSSSGSVAGSSSADDSLIDITDIRMITKLGRTAAYELTRRQGFPDPVPLSSRCYRWWRGEVVAFLDTLRQEPVRRARQVRRTTPSAPPRKITGAVRASRRRGGKS